MVPAHAEYQKAQRASQQLIQQQHENAMVLQELELAGEEQLMYKKIGPVLIRQEKVEAVSNVKKRLEFIENEVERLEDKMKNVSEKMAKKQRQISAEQQAGTK